MITGIRFAILGLALTLGACGPGTTDTETRSLAVEDTTHTDASAGDREAANPFASKDVHYRPADPALGFVDARETTDLNGAWRVVIDPMSVGEPGSIFGGFENNRQAQSDMDLIEYNFETSQQMRVPGDFNTQDERLFFYQGQVWYFRTFEASPAADARLHLWFGGANFKATLFLNGKSIGEHNGGYVPFSFYITDTALNGQNTLIVRVDNSLTPETVPTVRTDWWPYGGLTRDVMLVETPASYIQNAKIALTDRSAGLIEASVQMAGAAAGTSVTLTLPELGVNETATTDEAGQATFRFAASPTLWSPQSPQLYDVTFSAGADSVHDRVGFRTVETRGQNILLNGAPIKLKGISTHEEAIGRDGVAYSDEDVRGLLAEAKALNANFVRAAHYPYSRHMAKAADEMGLLLWEEIPVYWNIQWANADTLAMAKNMIERLVQRDWNRASVIVWSVANETPHSEARQAFLGELAETVRATDDTRLISAALFGNPQQELKEVALHIAARGLARADTPDQARAVFSAILGAAGDHAPGPNDRLDLTITDPLGELLDVVGYNEYFGWYYTGLFAQQMGIGQDVLRPIMLDLMPDIRIAASVDKPLIISEFGAGAKYGQTGTGVWSEVYQAQVYEAQIEMLRNSPQVQGMTPWILKDFRAMLRTLPGIQDYRNRKGLIDENGNRKEAFTVLQDFYSGDWEPPGAAVIE